MRLNVLKSYDQATAFLDSLNRLLLALGLASTTASRPAALPSCCTCSSPMPACYGAARAPASRPTARYSGVRTLAGYADTSSHGRVRFVIALTSNDSAMRFRLLKAIQSGL